MSTFERVGWFLFGYTMMLAGVLLTAKGISEWILHHDGYNRPRTGPGLIIIDYPPEQSHD